MDDFEALCAWACLLVLALVVAAQSKVLARMHDDVEFGLIAARERDRL